MEVSIIFLIVTIVLFILFAHRKEDKTTKANTVFDNKPKTRLEDHGLEEENISSNRDEFSKVDNNIISSFMSMRMLKPLGKECYNLSFLHQRNGVSDFCALSVKRLENYNASSYRIALVKVNGGSVVESCQIDYKPIKLTKKLQKELGREKVDRLMSKPEFKEVWPEISPYFESQVIVTYDEGYDMSVLSTLFNHYDIEYEPLCFLVAISKTHKRLRNLLEDLDLTIEDDDCLSLAKLVAEIQLSDTETDYLGLLKKKFWGKL